MPNQRKIRPLGAFIRSLKRAQIDAILIGTMAAVEQGAPLSTIDYDFWVELPERQIVRIYGIIEKLHGMLLAPTLYELSDGTQVNVILTPSGLRSFGVERKRCHVTMLDGQKIPVLPLSRIIASKQAAGRDKDLAVLPILRRTLKLSRKLQKAKGKEA